MLSEGAQADSVPTLEIEDNDVRCSHASAVGPIDESQLFYLESQGCLPMLRSGLIALGFMEDVLERFPVGGMVGWLRQAVAGKLASLDFAAARSASRARGEGRVRAYGGDKGEAVRLARRRGRRGPKAAPTEYAWLASATTFMPWPTAAAIRTGPFGRRSRSVRVAASSAPSTAARFP